MYIVQPTIHAGDRPGLGVWRCLACNWRMELKEPHTPLPPCGGECAKDAAVDAALATYLRVRGLVI